jgi:acetyl esterase/lipase
MLKHSLYFYIGKYLNDFLINRVCYRPDIKETRANFAKLNAKVPKGHPPVKVTHFENDQINGDWIEPKKGSTERTLLYFHGGGYFLDASAAHDIFLSQLSLKANIKVFTLNYSLIPEHPFPAALESAYAAYKWLLANGTDPKNIVFGGDSAGGGVALALLLYLKQKKEPLPDRLVLLSPFVDLTPEGKYDKEIVKRDVILKKLIQFDIPEMYAPNQDSRNPLISPLFGDFTGSPPILMFVATDDCLSTQDLALADRLKKQKVDIKLIVGEGMFHDWPVLLFPYVREAKEAMKEITSFLSPRVE